MKEESDLQNYPNRISLLILGLKRHLTEKGDTKALEIVEKIKNSYCKIGEGLIGHFKAVYDDCDNRKELIETIRGINRELQEGWK